MSSQRKTKRERELEAQAAALLGKHVSPQKQKLLLGVTLAACALPMLLAVRLWDQIPQLVHTGLIGTTGEDDSISRTMVVFGLPALMCLMDLIGHFTLYRNQKRNTVPPAYSRLMGRWGFPVISVLFCSGMTLQSAGGDLTLPFLTPCLLGLVFLMLGAHMWDCPKDAKLALRMRWTEGSDDSWNSAQGSDAVWKSVHRFAGWLWMGTGLLLIGWAMLTAGTGWAAGVFVLLAVAAPFVYAPLRANRPA